MGPPLGNDFVAFEVYKWSELKIHAGLSQGFLDIVFIYKEKKCQRVRKRQPVFSNLHDKKAISILTRCAKHPFEIYA